MTATKRVLAGVKRQKQTARFAGLRSSAAVCTGLLTACLALLAYLPNAQGQVSRKVLDGARIDPQVGQSLPLDALFRNHLGESVRLGEVISKRPTVLCLVYFECPMLCKLAADGLVKSVASLPESVGKDFDVLMVSFDPRDTAERAAAARKQAIKKYARDGTDAGWHFLTGEQQSIDRLTDAVGFHYVWDEDSQQFAHATGLMIVSPEGVVTEYLDGVRFSPKDIIAGINRASNNELSQSKATSFVRCYLYDPTTGKFGYAIQWTVRVLGCLTVVGIVVGIYQLQCHSEQANPVDRENGQ